MDICNLLVSFYLSIVFSRNMGLGVCLTPGLSSDNKIGILVLHGGVRFCLPSMQHFKTSLMLGRDTTLGWSMPCGLAEGLGTIAMTRSVFGLGAKSKPLSDRVRGLRVEERSEVLHSPILTFSRTGLPPFMHSHASGEAGHRKCNLTRV